MRWVKLTIDDSEMREKIAGALCECGYQVFCSCEKLPFSDTKAHLVWVLVDASYISNQEE